MRSGEAHRVSYILGGTGLIWVSSGERRGDVNMDLTETWMFRFRTTSRPSRGRGLGEGVLRPQAGVEDAEDKQVALLAPQPRTRRRPSSSVWPGGPALGRRQGSPAREHHARGSSGGRELNYGRHTGSRSPGGTQLPPHETQCSWPSSGAEPGAHPADICCTNTSLAPS